MRSNPYCELSIHSVDRLEIRPRELAIDSVINPGSMGKGPVLNSFDTPSIDH